MPSTLDKAQIGKAVRVTKVGGPATIRQRLMHMGLLKGACVRLERVAPLGDPFQIVVRGYRLAIRKKEAALIEVADVEHEASENREN